MILIGFTVAYLEDKSWILIQGCTNPRHQFAMVTKFCTVAPNICGSLVWNLLHVTHLAPQNLR